MAIGVKIIFSYLLKKVIADRDFPILTRGSLFFIHGRIIFSFTIIQGILPGLHSCLLFSFSKKRNRWKLSVVFHFWIKKPNLREL